MFALLHPTIAIDWSFRACSGAVTSDLHAQAQIQGLFDTLVGDFEPPRQSIQFDLLSQELLVDRAHERIHTLLMSIGGNDSGFVLFVVQYMVEPNNALDDPNLQQDINAYFEALADSYDRLDDGIADWLGNPSVLITTYPSPARGPNGFCGWYFTLAPEFFWALYWCCPVQVDPSNPVEEYRFGHFRYLLPLNRTVRDAAERHGWTAIDLEDNAGDHGLCNCFEPWFNTVDYSFLSGNPSFSVHPNSNGYGNMYRPDVYAALVDEYARISGLDATVTLIDLLAGLFGESDEVESDGPEPCPMTMGEILQGWGRAFQYEIARPQLRRAIDEPILDRLEYAAAILQDDDSPESRKQIAALIQSIDLAKVRARIARSLSSRPKLPPQIDPPLPHEPERLKWQKRVEAIMAIVNNPEFSKKLAKLAKKNWEHGAPAKQFFVAPSDAVLDRLYNGK